MLPTTPRERPFRVLLADRSEETRDLFSTLLAGMGHEVTAVATATEVLAYIPLFRPHAIFTSVFLPDQTGFELCAALRRMPETAGILIVAVTGHLAPDAARRAQEAGFDRYLVKPVQLDAIVDTMRLLDGGQGAAPRADRDQPATTSG